MIVLTFEVPNDSRLWKLQPAAVVVYLAARYESQRPDAAKEIHIDDVCPTMDLRARRSAVAELQNAGLISIRKGLVTMPELARKVQVMQAVITKAWAYTDPQTKKTRALTSSERKVWAYLCSQGSVCYETSAAISAKLEMSERQVYRSLNALEFRRLIDREGWGMSPFKRKHRMSDKQQEAAQSSNEKAGRVRRITLLNPHRPGESFFEYRLPRQAWKALLGDFAHPIFSEQKEELVARVLSRLGLKLFRSDPFRSDLAYYEAQEFEPSNTRRLFKFDKTTMYWFITATTRGEQQRQGTIYDLAEDANLDVQEFEDLVRSTRESVRHEMLNPPAKAADPLVVGDISEL